MHIRVVYLVCQWIICVLGFIHRLSLEINGCYTNTVPTINIPTVKIL